MQRLSTMSIVTLIIAAPATATVINITVPAEANVAFAGQTQSALEAFAAPSPGWESVPWDVGGEGNHGNFHNDTADWEGVLRAYNTLPLTDEERTAASTIAPLIDVSAGTELSITATGAWGKGPAHNTGPNGTGSNSTPGGTGEGEYDDFGIAWVSAPTGSLVGVFLTDADPDSGTLEHPLSRPPTLVFGTDDMTTPALQQSFRIGSGLGDITVPDGATRLFLGFHNTHEWWNNHGEMAVTIDIVPEPGTLSLIGFGTGALLRRRR